MNSRAKGARAERELAKVWSEIMGGPARRGQQFSGGTESPDVVISQRNIHVECKRVEAGNPYKWMSQAVRDAGQKVPCVLHRRNGEEWLLILRFADVPRFILAAQDVEQTAPLGVGEVPGADAGADLPAPGEA